MTRSVSHEAASEVLAAAALDGLPSDEQEAVLAHAASCSICGPELAALEESLAQLGDAASPLPADAADRIARTRTRLLARVGRRPARLAWMPLALAASVAGVAILARNDATLASRLAAARDSTAQLRDSTALLREARTQLAARDRLLDRLTGPETVVLSLAANHGPSASALLFWNRATNAWTMYARHLPPPPAGKIYELWLVTPTAKIPAGTFTPSPAGTAVVQATYPLDRNELRAAAVTEEPSPGVEQPTGPAVLVGQAK